MVDKACSPWRANARQWRHWVLRASLCLQDCSGTIDVDECMEILYRRFGKAGLEEKVNQFMALVCRLPSPDLPTGAPDPV